MAKSGGARAGAGRPVNPNSLRQTGFAGKASLDGWITLPPSYDGEAPEWPLPENNEPNLAERELKIWEAFWMRPQASQWAVTGMAYDVAIYVRLMASGEVAGDTKALAEARHRSNGLGLTASGMALLKWRYATGETETNDDAKTTQHKGGRVVSMRDRLAVINGGTQ